MIFYFTATGNSKFVAERISAAIGDRVVDIAKCIQDSTFDFKAENNESVGVVFPVYFFGIPMIVAEFLRSLKVSKQSDTYTYIVMNCGGRTAKAEKFVAPLFHADAVFGIETVDNYVPMYKIVSEGSIAERLDKAEQEIGEIVMRIKGRQRGAFNSHRGSFPNLVSSLLYPLYINGRKTSKFSVDSSCIGCGICEASCPRRAIRIVDSKPVWTIAKCELCLGCLHKCPSRSINYGKKSSVNGRYLNPRVHL